MSGCQLMLNDILLLLLKRVLMNVVSQQFYSDFSVVILSIVFVSIQELNDLGYPIHFTRDLSPCFFNTFSIQNVSCDVI